MVLSISAGIKLYRQKKYEKALRIFRRMAKRKSDDPEAHALVGMALHKLGRQFEALDACHEAQALADVAVRTHCAEINAAREMGRDDLVDDATAKAVSAYDSTIRAGYVRAKALDKLARFDEAAAELGVLRGSEPRRSHRTRDPGHDPVRPVHAGQPARPPRSADPGTWGFSARTRDRDAAAHQEARKYVHVD